MIEISHISRTFGDRLVLDDVSFGVEEGRMTGFVGGNGAGKTTTMRIILGVLASHGGEVRFHGQPLTAHERAQFGYMPEERGLYPKMKVEEQLVYLAKLHGIPGDVAKRETAELLGRLGLEERANDTLESLSLGNQQRAQIAAALVHRPTALVLDEPFSGLDPIAVEVVLGVLRDYAAQGAPVLFSSHQLDIVERLCDDVVVIGGGKILAAGSRESLRAEHAGRGFEIELTGAGADAGWVREQPGITVSHLDGGFARFDAETDDALLRASVRPYHPHPGPDLQGGRAVNENTITTQAHQLSAPQAAWLVAQREISTRLRSKAFLISTGILLVISLGGVLIAGFLAKSGESLGSPDQVAVVSGTQVSLDAQSYEVTEVADRAAAEALLRGGEVDAAVVPGGDTPVDLTVLASDSAPVDLIQALSAAPTVKLLDPDASNPFLAYLIAIAFGIVFMMSAITFGTTIAQSVVEEKQTRIVEILLATISSRSMLAGKILGNSILALAQVVAIAVLVSVGMLATGQDLLLGELGGALLWFAVLFAFGFVLLAGLYAALGSLVSRQEDIGSVTSPVMILIMLPYFGVIMFNDNPTVLAIMSYIPFSAPVGMPMRLYLGTAEWWEPVVSLGILAVAIAIVLWIGARIYSGSILRTGARVKISEALAAAKS